MISLAKPPKKGQAKKRQAKGREYPLLELCSFNSIRSGIQGYVSVISHRTGRRLKEFTSQATYSGNYADAAYWLRAYGYVRKGGAPKRWGDDPLDEVYEHKKDRRRKLQ